MQDLLGVLALFIVVYLCTTALTFGGLFLAIPDVPQAIPRLGVAVDVYRSYVMYKTLVYVSAILTVIVYKFN